MTAKKKATPKKPTNEESYADYKKALIESSEREEHPLQQLREIKADYLELSETIAAASAVAARILTRHSIGRHTTYGQGVTKPQF